MTSWFCRWCLDGIAIACLIAVCYVAGQGSALVIAEADGPSRAIELAIERGASG